MPIDQPITITSSPWYVREPATPVLPKAFLGLDFVLVQATHDNVPTIALLGTFRMPGRYAQVYGGSIPQALRIVAVNTATGQIYNNHATNMHATPLAAAMRPEPPPVPEGVAAPNSIEQSFNVDLCDQLGLPPEAGHYSVFVWIDDFVSPVREIDLVPFPKRPGKPGVPGDVPAFSRIHLRKLPESPEVAEKTVRLVDSDPGGNPAEIEIYGTVGAVVMDVRPGRDPHASAYLSVFALDYSDRQLSSRSVRLGAASELAAGFSFDFELMTLVSPIGRKKIFVVALAGITLSRVLVVKSK